MRKLVVVLLVAVVSASSLVVAGEYYTKQKGEEKVMGQPTEDMALVYVMRPAKLGAAIKTWAFYDDEFIGVSRSSGYSFALVPPGEHVFWSKAENTSALNVEVKAGETYYFKQKIVPGLGKARVKMELIDEAKAKKILEKCSHVVPTDEGRQRAVEIASNRLERAEKKAEKKEAKEEAKSDE